jgi:hypothetical protein
LSNGRERLYLGEVFWSSGQVHAPQSYANGARGYDDDAMAVGTQLACCFDDECEDREERLMCLFVDYGRGTWKNW